jgi:hypothetical protein
MSPVELTAYLVALAVVLAFALWPWRARYPCPLPPGPKPLPLIGNLLDLPMEKDWLTYRKWNEQYGDIVYLEALGRKILVLGPTSVVDDLLERRSSVYSDRASAIMANDL